MIVIKLAKQSTSNGKKTVDHDGVVAMVFRNSLVYIAKVNILYCCLDLFPNAEIHN